MIGEVIVLDLAEVASDDRLHPDERVHAATLSPVRRREFIAGRTALRRLVDASVAILGDDRGAPILPVGLVGSISHTATRVAAIVAPDEGWREAIYKAIDPFVRRYVGFQEVELAIEDDGRARVVATLLPLEIEARWERLDDGHWLSTARALRRR
ncbi:MAG: hypothetical protein NT062_14570 [Proteobacteria bacterium]|nr:hypothetical protein [Pseudomonadota bacterium]